MLHRHYRKLCHLLADLDSWGQAATINTLLRYGRTQFDHSPTHGNIDMEFSGAERSQTTCVSEFSSRLSAFIYAIYACVGLLFTVFLLSVEL